MYEVEEEEELRGFLAVGWQLIFNRLDCFPSRIRAGPDRGTPEKKCIYKKKKGRDRYNPQEKKKQQNGDQQQPAQVSFFRGGNQSAPS